jgi:hypothetical protein
MMTGDWNGLIAIMLLFGSIMVLAFLTDDSCY